MNWAALLLIGAWFATASGLPSADGRAARLERALVAPCCWSESVALHRSPIALQIRAEIASFVRQGKTDREILDYYKAKYGKRILIEPEGARRVLVNVVPWLVAVLGMLAVALTIRRMVRAGPRTQPETPGPSVELPDEWQR